MFSYLCVRAYTQIRAYQIFVCTFSRLRLCSLILQWENRTGPFYCHVLKKHTAGSLSIYEATVRTVREGLC